MIPQHDSSAELLPHLKYQVQDAMQSSTALMDEINTNNNTNNSNNKDIFGIDLKQSNVHDLSEMPELPDFTKRPKILPSNSNSNNDNFFLREQNSKDTNVNHFSGIVNNNFNNDPRYVHNEIHSQSYIKNANVAFFSDEVNDEHTYNELPLNEILDDFEYGNDDDDDKDALIEEFNNEEDASVEAESYSCSLSRDQTPDPQYQYLGKDINRAESPFLKKDLPEYTTEIPPFYDSTTLKYPYKSPLDYTDEEFDQMNHFDFLKELKFEVPPVLPVYLNSNLLNDSTNKNYKTFPYQFQESTVPHVNEIYRYRINDLNIMDKYGIQKVSRPPLKRSGGSSNNSSSSSTSVLKNASNNKSKLVRHKLARENSNGSSNTINTLRTTTKLKHADKMQLIERNLVPHHVMLNHLITCNFNRDGYITGSCITRYKGKFITQIMYFSNEEL